MRKLGLAAKLSDALMRVPHAQDASLTVDRHPRKEQCSLLGSRSDASIWLCQKGETIPRAEAALWAIETAVTNAERGTVEGKELKTGFAAWEMWIDELPIFDQVVERTRTELEKAGRNDDPAFELQLGNAWCYENLHFARFEAEKYLGEISGDMPEPARPHLAKAVDEYGQICKALVPEGECFTEIAPYPWMPKPQDKPWSDDMRKRQAGLLRDAIEHERAAVDALKAALAAMGR